MAAQTPPNWHISPDCIWMYLIPKIYSIGTYPPMYSIPMYIFNRPIVQSCVVNVRVVDLLFFTGCGECPVLRWNTAQSHCFHWPVVTPIHYFTTIAEGASNCSLSASKCQAIPKGKPAVHVIKTCVCVFLAAAIVRGWYWKIIFSW